MHVKRTDSNCPARAEADWKKTAREPLWITGFALETRTRTRWLARRRESKDGYGQIGDVDGPETGSAASPISPRALPTKGVFSKT